MAIYYYSNYYNKLANKEMSKGASKVNIKPLTIAYFILSGLQFSLINGRAESKDAAPEIPIAPCG
ncbi:hypothetical protein XBKQ1_1430003 [Xenorhabdus bovienii str. kraussei Quebec]|uniref:Uncharacterized protein n=2 Tax=Xenorhabdus bovienii TaxID=40576 RepID=A0A077PDI1_XENBV|nr:hypothetical protein XBO1_480078 [Xenorhabdus bovienii str. oregonense]CDH18682.1 hypothetical protein XBKQ1_1430003 [Xenorhabdus bovienii str. kraussei Quebec]